MPRERLRTKRHERFPKLQEFIVAAAHDLMSAVVVGTIYSFTMS
jgi:hypothetical protein